MANDAGVKTDFTILDRVLNMFRGAPYVKIGIWGVARAERLRPTNAKWRQTRR